MNPIFMRATGLHLPSAQPCFFTAHARADEGGGSLRASRRKSSASARASSVSNSLLERLDPTPAPSAAAEAVAARSGRRE